MQSSDFKAALSALLFERAKSATGLVDGELRGCEVTTHGARVVLGMGDRLVLVRIALSTGDAAVAYDEGPVEALNR